MALPAYQDYTLRARVAELIHAASACKSRVARCSSPADALSPNAAASGAHNRTMPRLVLQPTAARVRRKQGPNVEIDELAIGFGPFHEKFVSRVTKKTDDPEGLRIETVGTEGPFKALLSHWLFRPHPDGTNTSGSRPSYMAYISYIPYMLGSFHFRP